MNWHSYSLFKATICPYQRIQCRMMGRFLQGYNRIEKKTKEIEWEQRKLPKSDHCECCIVLIWAIK